MSCSGGDCYNQTKMEKVKKTRSKLPNAEADKKQTEFEQTMYQRNLFLSMALNMTWQLALVVIIPIVGGFKLDEHFGTSPLWTIFGVVLAGTGVIAVLRRVVVEANRKSSNPKESKK